MDTTVTPNDVDGDVDEVDRADASDAAEVLAGRERRLDVIRAVILAAAAMGVISVVAPWWHTTIPPSTMQILGPDGLPQVIELGWGEATTTGLAGGELTRTVLLAVAAGGVWYAFGRRWWWIAPVVLWATNPAIALAPPSAPPAGRVGARSHLAELTTDMWGLTLNRVAFYVLCCAIIAGGVQAWRVKSAAKALDRAEGRPAGLWEKRILPRLAEAGVSINIGNKHDANPGSSPGAAK